MAQFHDSKWWSGELKRMLKNQEPENLHLDYKDKRSLLPRGRGGGGIDKQKRANDVSKDVSSFLNSDGGILIYGVPETSDPHTTGGAPVPLTELDRIGFERGEIDKETIENLVTSNIQPKPGPDLFQIEEVEYVDRIIYIVQVAVGIGEAWQATDKRYYKRFHYKAEAMEHYEINMVRERDTTPNLKLVFGLDEHWRKENRIVDLSDDFAIYIGVQNYDLSVVEAAYIELGLFMFDRIDRTSSTNAWPVRRLLRPFLDAGQRFFEEGASELRTDWYELSWPIDGMYRPIFKKVSPTHVSHFKFSIKENQRQVGR